MLKSFFGSLARYLVLTVNVLAVLWQFGIQTTSIETVPCKASPTAPSTATNLAAGVMLLIFGPFRICYKVRIGNAAGTIAVLDRSCDQ